MQRSSLMIIGFIVLSLMVFGCSADKQSAADQLVNEANSLQQNGDLPSAVAKLHEAIIKDPGHSEAYRQLANLYVAQDQMDLAEQNYLKALQINPNDANLFNSMGIFYIKKGDAQQALNSFTTAIKIDPTNVAAHHNLGDVTLAAGKPEIAIGFYQKALTIDPNYEPSATKLAQIAQLLRQAQAQAATNMQDAVDTTMAQGNQ